MTTLILASLIILWFFTPIWKWITNWLGPVDGLSTISPIGPQKVQYYVHGKQHRNSWLLHRHWVGCNLRCNLWVSGPRRRWEWDECSNPIQDHQTVQQLKWWLSKKDFFSPTTSMIRTADHTWKKILRVIFTLTCTLKVIPGTMKSTMRMRKFSSPNRSHSEV